MTLGTLAPGGVAPSIFVLVERGAARRPAMAARTSGEVVLEFAEGYPPISIAFGEEEIVVGEDVSEAPDATIAGSLPLLSSLLVGPTFGGVPRSRAAVGAYARGELSVAGRRGLARRLLALIALNSR